MRQLLVPEMMVSVASTGSHEDADAEAEENEDKEENGETGGAGVD